MVSSFWVEVYSDSSFIASFLLLFSLCLGLRWREFPVFFAFAVFQVLRTILLSIVRHTGDAHLYYYAYYALGLSDYSLQFGLVIEIALKAFGSVGELKQKLGHKVFVRGSLGTIAAALTSLCVANHGAGNIWKTRVSLFTSLAVTQCLLIISASINRHKIRRSPRVLSLGNGFALIMVAGLVRDGAFAATGWTKDFTPLRHLQAITYLAVAIYWTIALGRFTYGRGTPYANDVEGLGISWHGSEAEAKQMRTR